MADPHGYRPTPGSIPESPGVYRFRDGHGRVIYVGKAKNLRSRLNSYFADFAGLHPRTQSMLTSAAAVPGVMIAVVALGVLPVLVTMVETRPRG